MRSFSISPAQYQKITRISLLLLAFIIVTGAAVRLSGSGLGCSDWPTCENDQLVAEIDDVHAMVEFVNRVITGFVALAVIIAVLGSLFRTPKRKDLTYLSIGLVFGVIVQVIVGALVVREHLPPSLVITHFLVSMVLVWNAVELDHRSRLPDRADKSLPAKTLKGLTKLLLAIGVVVIVTGTIVTGSGPHSGAEKQQILEALENQGETPAISTLEVERLPFDVPDVARIHGISVMIFLLLTLRVLFMIKRNSPTLLPNGQNLMAAIIVQAAPEAGYQLLDRRVAERRSTSDLGHAPVEGVADRAFDEAIFHGNDEGLLVGRPADMGGPIGRTQMKVPRSDRIFLGTAAFRQTADEIQRFAFMHEKGELCRDDLCPGIDRDIASANDNAVAGDAPRDGQYRGRKFRREIDQSGFGHDAISIA